MVQCAVCHIILLPYYFSLIQSIIVSNLYDLTGLTADARVLIDRARVECQSHRLTVEDPVSLEYITRHIAQVKQKYTQSNGRRPFGITALLAGFDPDGTARLFQTDPSGVYHEWKVGRFLFDWKALANRSASVVIYC